MIHRKDGGDLPKELIPATLSHVVIGQRLFLNDPRRTPVIVVAHDASTASFTAEVMDFEDQGAHWTFALWDIAKFLTARSAQRLNPVEAARLGVDIERLNQTLEIECCEKERERALTEISAMQGEAEACLNSFGSAIPRDAHTLFQSDRSCPNCAQALEGFLQSKDLLDLDRAFVEAFVSNPHAGETIKAHRIVLAEMGLCPYSGLIVREPRAFEGRMARARRRSHIVTRLAFMRAFFDRLGAANLPLYRSVYSKQSIEPPRNNGFVSTTFSQEVALSFFDTGKRSGKAVMYWQSVPKERAFLSFIETAALSSKYREAEAVLLFDPSNPLF